MKRFQWKWIFTGSKTCCTIWRPFWFAMAAILYPKWPPKYKNPPDLSNIWFPSRFCSCELISIIVFLELGAINDLSDHIISCSYYYSSYSFFLSSVKSLSDTFLGDALIKFYEILQEYHMPCEVVLLKVDFFKMAAVSMETAKMLKKMKNTKMIIHNVAGYLPNRN